MRNFSWLIQLLAAAETRITDSSVYFVSVSDTGKVFMAIV